MLPGLTGFQNLTEPSTDCCDTLCWMASTHLRRAPLRRCGGLGISNRDDITSDTTPTFTLGF